MKYIFSLILALLPLLISGSGFAADSAEASYSELFNKPANNADLLNLSQQLSPSAQTKGSFSQYRYLKVLKKPLVSQGEFIFSKDLGIIWQQNSPFASTLILKDKQLIQIDSQGNINVNHAEQAGSANMMSDIMPKLLSALLSGDINQLQQHFELSLNLDGKPLATEAGIDLNTTVEPTAQWQLGLKPIDPMLAKALPKMVLAGKQQIQTLVLYSANGDRSQIQFSALDESPLSSQDKARYEPNSVGTAP